MLINVEITKTKKIKNKEKRLFKFFVKSINGNNFNIIPLEQNFKDSRSITFDVNHHNINNLFSLILAFLVNLQNIEGFVKKENGWYTHYVGDYYFTIFKEEEGMKINVKF